MTRRRMLLGGAAALALVLVAVVLLVIFRQGTPEADPTPTPSAASVARKPSNERFGPRPRPVEAANIDVGIRILPATASASPTPGPAGRTLAQTNPESSLRTLPSADPSVTPAPRPTAPPPPLPRFTPLPLMISSGVKEVVVVYVKGETGKRQVYLRSLERDKDEQLVTDVYDDFGVAFSGASQKVAFYSNEEGPSDSTRARTTLKVVDLGTRQVSVVATALPGNAPVAWSPDGRVLAIPTQNSIFLSDITTGNSLQVPTGANPSGLVWGATGFTLYFHAEDGSGKTDIFEANGITAAARAITVTPENERLPATSQDGSRLTFLREQENGAGSAVVIRNLLNEEEQTLGETIPTTSYIFNLRLNDVIFAQGTDGQKLSRLRNEKVEQVGDLKDPVVVGWDRDYEHVFVLAEGLDGITLYSVELANGLAEVVKGGLAEGIIPPVR